MQPIRGKDIQVATTISFAESYTGVIRQLTFQTRIICPTCSGSGLLHSRRCPNCEGNQLIASKRLGEARIPAGVDQNTLVKIAGEGEPGLFGGAPGDLYVRINVQVDPNFGRNQSDLYVSAKIGRSVARAGGDFPVTMPDGSTAIIRVPAGITDGITIRVRNQGMPVPNTKQKGSLYIAVKIVPDSVASSKADNTRQKAPQPLSNLKKPQVHTQNVLNTLSSTHANSVIGNYRIRSLLGAGGFADVFLAEHLYLHTQAAIKRLHGQVQPQEQDKFLQEARTIATLRHPHIIRVLDFGIETASNTPYLIMDYATGGALQSRHPEGSKLPFDVIVSYAEQIAEALDYAHQHKIVHRDVKPANMLIEHDQLLLSDFGIAVTAHTTQSLVTQEAIGTVIYMAPEQIRKKAQPASDQYALAVVIYEWLAGEPPFRGDPIEIAMSHIGDAPPLLRSKVPALPAKAEEVLFRALHKDPAQRYPSVGQFISVLKHALS